MEHINELMDEYRIFLVTESESIRDTVLTYGKAMHDSIAAINEGVYVAPAYELERFLVQTLLKRDPKKYTVHRNVTVGNRTLLDEDSISEWFKEKVKPPWLRNYRHSRPDWPEKEAEKVLDHDVAAIIAKLADAGLIFKSQGYGVAKDKGPESEKYITPFPFTVDDQILDTLHKTNPKKKRLCDLLHSQGITFVRIVRPMDTNVSPWVTKELSLQQIANDSIEHLAWGHYHRDHSFRFDTYGCVGLYP